MLIIVNIMFVFVLYSGRPVFHLPTNNPIWFGYLMTVMVRGGGIYAPL